MSSPFQQINWRNSAVSEDARSVGISPDETFENDKSTIIRSFQTDWAHRQQTVRDFLGYPEVATDQLGNKYIRRNIPHQDVEYDKSDGITPFLFATKIKVTGLGPRGTVHAVGGGLSGAGFVGTFRYGTYDTARLLINYNTLPYEILPDGMMAVNNATDANHNPDESKWVRYVMKVVRPSTEFFTIPAGAMKQVGGTAAGTPTVVGVGKSLSFLNLQITWYEVPEKAVPCLAVNPTFTPANCLENIIGTVNNADFNGYFKATLLLLSAELKPYRSPFGDRIYDITYHIKHFGPGVSNDAGATAPTVQNHQKIFRVQGEATPGWYEITSGGATNFGDRIDGKSIYNWRDFSLLFKVGS